MKYYVEEQFLNLKGKVIEKSRITGDITDISWAKTQMETRFNIKLIEYRHQIKPGAIKISSTYSELELKNGTYRIQIKTVLPHVEPTARNLLLGYVEKYKGNWGKVYSAIQSREDIKPELDELLSKSRQVVITLLDENCPKQIKCSYQPPIALYYGGDVGLLSSKNHVRLAIGCGRECYPALKSKAMSDIRKLPKNYIIVTSDPDIIDDCLIHNRKIILVKSCGISQKMPRVTTRQEIMIVQNGGLVITEYPDSVEATPITCRDRLRIVSAVCDGLFIIHCEQASSAAMLVALATVNGKDVMVYPTFPEFRNTMNNELIADGAVLVENEKDIIDTLHL